MTRPPRRATLLAAAVAALALAGGAQAKSFDLPQANVTVVVGTDGSLRVTEQLTYAFSGAFSGANRDIPLRSGESIDQVSVSENGRSFAAGGCVELGCSSPAGTFGVVRTGDTERVVWHFSASDAVRTFEIHYRMQGLAVAYDDVVDVNLKVWGDQWDSSLGRLTATTTGPGDVVRAWGHPVWVRGDVTLDGASAHLRALDVPAHQFVELRTLFPRSAFTSTGGMRVADGPGLQKIVAEELDDAAAYERDKKRIDDAIRHPWRTALILLALGVLPALAITSFVFWRFGRELETRYDREYEQEPPTETQAALVPTLLRQGGEAGSFEFTATLFDLIRRGHYRADHVTTERSVWGGIRHESISDLELSHGTPVELTTWERSVAEVVDDVLGEGAERLSAFRSKIEERPRDDGAPVRRASRRRSRARWRTAAGSAPWASSLSSPGSPCSPRSAPSWPGSRSTAGGTSTRAGATSSCSRSPSARS